MKVKKKRLKNRQPVTFSKFRNEVPNAAIEDQKYCPYCSSIVAKVYPKAGYNEKMCRKCYKRLPEKNYSKAYLQRSNHGHFD